MLARLYYEWCWLYLQRVVSLCIRCVFVLDLGRGVVILMISLHRVLLRYIPRTLWHVKMASVIVIYGGLSNMTLTCELFDIPQPPTRTPLLGGGAHRQS